VLGGEVTHHGTRVAQGHLHLVQQPGPTRLALHLDLAELQRDAAPVRHRHRVVDHLERDPVLAVAELVRLADGCEGHHRRDRGATGVDGDEIEQALRRGRGGADHRYLGADTRHVGGQLHRPRLVVAAAEAQAGAGPGQTQVGGVEVGGAEFALRAHDEAAPFGHALGEVGHGEPGRDLVLALLLQHWSSLTGRTGIKEQRSFGYGQTRESS